jgi:hypothetical protein
MERFNLRKRKLRVRNFNPLFTMVASLTCTLVGVVVLKDLKVAIVKIIELDAVCLVPVLCGRFRVRDDLGTIIVFNLNII